MNIKEFIHHQVKVMTHLIDEMDVVADYLIVNKQPDKAAIVSTRKYLIEESCTKLIEMCDRLELQGTGYVSDEAIRVKIKQLMHDKAESNSRSPYGSKGISNLGWMGIAFNACSWLRDQIKSPWISVDERLPEYDNIHNCLCVFKNKAVMEMNYDGFNDRWFNLSLGDVSKSNPVTHWMPLPSPPNFDNDLHNIQIEADGRCHYCESNKTN